ncbi:hyaluronidase-1 [Aplochiton taeniatus]
MSQITLDQRLTLRSGTKQHVRHRTCRATIIAPVPFFLGWILLFTCIRPSLCGPPQSARAPLLSNQPFLIFWGIQDSVCSGRPDPGAFGMEREGRVAIFYEDTLGKYPYYTDQDTAVSGGLPQHTRLDEHIQQTGEDIIAALPAPRYLGLGVVRWAEWVPQWARNREKQTIYLEKSRALLRTFFPDWSPEEVEKWSKVDFEAAAQSILMETLWEARRLRPKALWGVSPYPGCYNSDPTQTQLANYTGRCPTAEMALNNELMWLWKRCSALFPLLTLEKIQGGTSGARLYASNQIQEAMRVAALAGTLFDLPVFPMVRSVYTSTNNFLSETDLVNTIGESAAMGAAGAVIWEKEATKTQRECSDLAVFVREILGPYSVNVTTSTRLCSVSLCQGRGRCVRRTPEAATYLHLPSTDFLLMVEKVEGIKATGQLEPANLEVWKRDFQCQWYETLQGAVADQESPKDGVAEGEARAVGEELLAPTVKSLSIAGSVESGIGTPSLSVEVPMDHGAHAFSDPLLTMMLLATTVIYLDA